jgi:hypothetical protein
MSESVGIDSFWGRAMPKAYSGDLRERRPPLYWLAAFCVIAGSVPASSQSDSQLPSKLVGTGAVGPAEQAWSVALSADGTTAIVGGLGDNSYTGAAWVFTRSGAIWTQQGSKLVGTDTIGRARQGQSVALSADGSTAIAGGIADNRITGAAWVNSRSGGVWTPTPATAVGFLVARGLQRWSSRGPPFKGTRAE